MPYSLPFLAYRPAPVVSVLRLNGVIGPSARFRAALNLCELAQPIANAFAPRNLAAVALVVNSPGGAPVQSMLIHRRIRSLAEEKSVPVIAFAEDVAASGGYILALAGDEIFADESSVVGSIGVISAGFGLTGLIGKLGVERRVYARGPHKGMLDPFRAEDPEDVKRLDAIQKDVHGVFMDLVRNRRAERLKAGEDELFSGEFWSGLRAVDLGLADGIADMRGEMRRRFGPNVRLRLVTRHRPIWRRIGAPTIERGFGLGGGFAEELLAGIEARALWQRFGL